MFCVTAFCYVDLEYVWAILFKILLDQFWILFTCHPLTQNPQYHTCLLVFFSLLWFPLHKMDVVSAIISLRLLLDLETFLITVFSNHLRCLISCIDFSPCVQISHQQRICESQFNVLFLLITDLRSIVVCEYWIYLKFFCSFKFQFHQAVSYFCVKMFRNYEFFKGGK